jgi:hypothetical protein
MRLNNAKIAQKINSKNKKRPLLAFSLKKLSTGHMAKYRKYFCLVLGLICSSALIICLSIICTSNASTCVFGVLRKRLQITPSVSPCSLSTMDNTLAAKPSLDSLFLGAIRKFDFLLNIAHGQCIAESDVFNITQATRQCTN